MHKNKWIMGIAVVIVLGIARFSTAEVVVFNTGEVAGFDNLVLKIEPTGWGKAHSYWEILRFLLHNRSMSGDFVRINENENDGEVGAEIDMQFMLDHVISRLNLVKGTEDIFDPVGDPGDGYEYDMHIVHPGSEEGVLEGDTPHPIIIMCQGFTGGAVGWEDVYDEWLATHYAEQGYIFAMPRLFENFRNDPRTEKSNTDDIAKFMLLMSDIASLQVSDAIDYLAFHFGNKVNKSKVTLIGHSNGGFIALLTAARDWRVKRIAFLSSTFKLYGKWDGEELSDNYSNVLDSYDVFRYLNRRNAWSTLFPWLVDGPSLHVQRGVSDDTMCPPETPCDMFVDYPPYDLSMDPWIPFEGCGGPCGDKTLTFYNWAIYEGPKENGVKDNPYTNHGYGGTEGREEAIRLLDDFFKNFPLD